jgi:hypothetical protein
MRSPACPLGALQYCLALSRQASDKSLPLTPQLSGPPVAIQVRRAGVKEAEGVERFPASLPASPAADQLPASATRAAWASPTHFLLLFRY